MKRKILIISLIIITLISCILYYTYAIDITMEETSSTEADLAYNININDTDGRSITVSPNTTKVFDIFLSSNNNGTIKYGFSYKETTSSGIEVKMLNTSTDKVEGTINNKETKKVTLVIDNNTSNSITYNIIPVTGYQNGGNLIIPSGYTLISNTYSFPIIYPKIDNSGANAGSSSSETCNEYTTSLGMNASSTGNIYGIYDLSGGAYEYVMGNMSSGSGSYTYNASCAGSNFSYSASTAKYIDT